MKPPILKIKRRRRLDWWALWRWFWTGLWILVAGLLIADTVDLIVSKDSGAWIFYRSGAFVTGFIAWAAGFFAARKSR